MSWQDATIIIAVLIHLSLVTLHQAFRHDRATAPLLIVTKILVWSLPLLFPPFICFSLLAVCCIVALSSRHSKFAALLPTARQNLAFIAIGLLIYSLVSFASNQSMPDLLVAVGALGASVAVFWKQFLRSALRFSA